MTTNQDFHIDSLLARVTGIEEQLADARRTWYTALPEFPADGICVGCGADWTDDYGSVQRMETGYVRWTNGEVQEVSEGGPKFAHWQTDGWDDMSEHGDFEWVECNSYRAAVPAGCGMAYKIPEREEWD